MSKFVFLFAAFSLMNSTACYADDDAALKDVQNMMRSESQRAEVIKNDSKAQQADNFASQAVGGDKVLKNDIYDLSADILGVVKDMAGGDQDKMLQLLQKAMQNPGEFLKSLPAAQQAKVRGIANKVEENKKPSPKP